MAIVSSRAGAPHIWRFSANGGQPKQISEEEAVISRWSPDGKWIYFNGLDKSAGNLWVVPADGGRARRVTDLAGKRGTLVETFATDGRYLYFAWQEGLGDIWVADVVYD
jgi:Tol biopolymer transport system component